VAYSFLSRLASISQASLGWAFGTKKPPRKRQKPAVRLPPRPIFEPTHYLSVVAIVKNEGPYLREWIEFQRLMGAARVYLYDNGSTDESAEVLAPFVAEGFATVIPWATFDEQASPQRQAYAHALCNFGPDFRWMAFIDLDEFLFPVKAPDLVSVLRAYEDYANICVPWFIFGFSGHDTPPPGLVIENYTERAPFPPDLPRAKLLNWKSIVHPAEVASVENPHMFELTSDDIGAIDENRQAVANDIVGAPPPGAVLRINHYITRSRQEFELKLEDRTPFRSRPARKLRVIADVIEAQTVHDDTILRFLPALRERMEIGERQASSQSARGSGESIALK
jgi:hypothetical protein